MGAFAFVVLTGACIGAAGNENLNAKAIDVKIIKYDGLKEAVRKNRGKVVLVCFWANWHPPSIRNLGPLVALQKKYSDKGLETITVEVGARAMKETANQQQDWILDRLKRINSHTANFILDEEGDLIVKRLGTEAPYNCAFVFNCQGKWVRFSINESESPVDPLAIEKLVARFLEEK
jgi:hypothetical protein